MWTTLALFLAVQAAPAQASALAIENDRFTYGLHGPTRKDGDFLPGEMVFLAFEIRNMKLDASGRASFAIAMEVQDGAGQLRFRQVPHNQHAQNYLGGNALPSVAQVQIPLESKAGAYTIKLLVQDRVTNASTMLERKARVLPAAFGLIHVHTSADREGMVPVTPVGAVGESLYVNFAVVGFQRNGAQGQPDLEVALRVLDDKSQPTAAQPLTGKANKDVPAEVKILPLQFGLTLNRVGRFTVELNATDKAGGKSARVSFPIRVIPPL